MSGDYGSHRDYTDWVKEESSARQSSVENALRAAFVAFIEKREVEVIVFDNVSALQLAEAVIAYPLVLKAIISSCNIAARAIERDLGIRNLDSYAPQLTHDQAKVIAGYVKPFLPSWLEIPALLHIDRVLFIDKEIRKGKGRWEIEVIRALSEYAGRTFRKRKFTEGGQEFELDAASPASGAVAVGVDIKRIEARRDIHKRCDEIVNKARKLKAAFPGAKFGVVIYYPFIEEHVNVKSRLESPDIDGVVFAAQTAESIESAARHLLAMLRMVQ